MAFPTTSVIDDFNRSNGGLGSSWSNLNGGAAATINSNTVASSNYSEQWYNSSSFTGDGEVYFTISAVSTTNSQGLYADIFTGWSSSTLSSLNGYQLEILRAGTNDTFRLYKYTGGSYSAMNSAQAISGHVAAGDQVGFSRETSGSSSVLKMWRKPSAGSWTQIGSNVTDSSSAYFTAGQSWQIGFGIYGSAWRVDDFGGGTVVASGGSIAATGITSTTTLGSPTVSPGAVNISPTGIASTSSIGSPTIASTVTISPSGIASTASIGSPTATPGTVTISPTGKASTTSIGVPSLSPGSVAISPTGINSTASVGSPTLLSVYTVSPAGIAATSSIGSPSLSPGAVTISPSAIASASSIGSPTITASNGTQTISPTGIDSTTAIGSITATPGGVSIQPSSISSTLAFGSAGLSPGAATISPASIISTATLGTVALSSSVTLSPSGISSGSSIGAPTLSISGAYNQTISPRSITPPYPATIYDVDGNRYKRVTATKYMRL